MVILMESGQKVLKYRRPNFCPKIQWHTMLWAEGLLFYFCFAENKMNPSMIFYRINDKKTCGEWMRHMITVIHGKMEKTNGWKLTGDNKQLGKDTKEYSKCVLSTGSCMTWHFRIHLTVLEISHKKFIKSKILKIPNREFIQDKNKRESSYMKIIHAKGYNDSLQINQSRQTSLEFSNT